jgi:hypothetical protein
MTTTAEIKTMIANSPTYRARALAEIPATQRLLDKQLSYSPDLQDAEMIASYRAHIAHLNGLLGK